MSGTNGREPRILTVSDILDAPDLGDQLVEVREWGGAVRVRPLSLEEVFAIRKEATRGTEIDEEQAGLLMIARGMTAPIFDEAHLTQLRKKNAGALNTVLAVIARLSGTDKDALAQVKATFPAGPGEAVPVPAGAGPEHDGS